MMARRHLHELLGEEQEPFALKSFIDERRSQLRRPSSKDSPSSHHHHQHLQMKRRTSPVLESRAFSSSVLAKSPSSSFIPFREPFDCKRSPLLQRHSEKSPTASRLTAAILLEAAVRIQKQEQQQQSEKKRRRRRKNNKEAESPSNRFGLGFLASVLNRLVVRKRQRGITGEEEEGPSCKSPPKDLLKWDNHNGGIAGERTVQAVTYQQKEEDFDVFDPHCSLQTDREHRNGGDGKHPHSSICCRCGIPECPRSGGGGPPSVSDGDSIVLDAAGRVSNTSPSRQPPGPSSAGGPSPELRTPAGTPDRRRTERQLLGGTTDDGRAESPYYKEKKEQSSPVSVLDPGFDEEDPRHHHGGDQGHHHPELEEKAQEGEEREEEEDEEDAESFQHSLAVVQRAKQELLSRIRRFERLAELDPVELERRLTEEEDIEEDEDGGGDDPNTLGTSPDAVEMQTLEVCELVGVVLGLSGGAGSKISGDMRRLVADLAEEEKNGSAVEKTAEGVRMRFEAWRGVESNTIDMMVEKDLMQEGDGWRRFPEQVREAVTEVEAAVLHLLVDELITAEFVGCTD